MDLQQFSIARVQIDQCQILIWQPSTVYITHINGIYCLLVAILCMRILPLFVVCFALFGVLLASVAIVTSEDELNDFILSRPIALVLVQTKSDSPKNVFHPARNFFLSDEWTKYIEAIETQDFYTAAAIFARLKETELKESLGGLMDKLLEVLISNYRFINLVKEIALVNCDEFEEMCENRIEWAHDPTDETGIILQL